MTKPLAIIIEDDPQLGKIYVLALKADFETELIPEGDLAITRLGQLTPELIVVDLHLPGASGQEILSYIHASPHLEDSRIILATADHQQADQLEDQAEILLLKPISPIQLREISRRLCGIQD